ncbi:hypothetical protein R1sor_022839 [Riccia sorocarpa]|uniref:ORC1/DEAH AAA+ ATPase domain-containing protein n=1 Tax=Riccia sorocarpa TaxID=122646 RepID=A0ABD3GLS0_9MARC
MGLSQHKLILVPVFFFLQRTDAVYRVYNGNRKGRGCQIVFLHGLQVNHKQEEDAAYLRKCWSSRDGCELWPKWLAGSFPSASIYLVKYDSRLHEDDKNKQRDMHITAEGILSDLLLANIGQSPKNPVILVGQDIGGLVIKTICLLASRHLGEEKKRLFSQQVKGIVYYSTPHLGVRMEFGDCELDAKLAKVLTIHNAEIVRSNEEFRRLRGKMKWRCIALWASHVDPLNVEEGTARFDVDIFCPIDGSAMNICKPEDRSSSSFGQLDEFIRETLFGNRKASRPRLDFKEDPKYVPLQKTSNKIRSLLADPKRQVVVLVGDAGTGKSGVAKYLALQYDMETAPEAAFLDGVFCVDCGRGANAVPILRRLLRQMKVPESTIETTEDVDFLTYLLKENVQDLSALMIFDDVSGDDRNSMVEKLVIPSAEDVKYLFTSQESRGLHGYSVEKIEIITDAVAEEIIAKRIGLPNGTIPEADKVTCFISAFKYIMFDFHKCQRMMMSSVSSVGHRPKIIKATDFHPLALASVAAAVQTNDKGGVDPSEWKEVKENLLFYLTDEKGVDAFGKSYLPRSVFAAMMFAVQVLHREDKILFEALCILALFEGPFPRKVPLLLLLSIKSTLSRHFIRFMKELESRGFVKRVTINAKSSLGNLFYYTDIRVPVPSCKMHSLRQQFMLLFLREDVASFRRSSFEFRDSVDAVQEIISPFLNEASEGRNSKYNCRVADLLFPDHILKANLGMLMMDIGQDTDSVFLLEVQRVVLKYIVDGEIDDVSMANLIGRHDHKALLFFSLHVIADPFSWKDGGKCSMANRVLRNGFSDWKEQQVSSNRKSVEAVFCLLLPSCSTTEAQFQVQMFALQLLQRLKFGGSALVFRGILVSDPAIVDSIRRIVTKLAEYVNASPLVVPKMESTEVDILRGEDHATEFRSYFEGGWYSESTSLEMDFRDCTIRPIQTILSAVQLLDIHQSLERDETGLIIFDEGLALIESISEPLLCIARVLGQRMTRKSSTLNCLALSVLVLIDEISRQYTDKWGRSGMDFMPNTLESMVAGTGVEAVYDDRAFIVLEGHFSRSSCTTISHFIPKLTDFIRKGRYEQQTLEYFLSLFKEGHDMTGICSADRQDLSEALFSVLGLINEIQGVEGRMELRVKILIVLLLLGHPQEYQFESSVGIRAIQFQLRQSIDAESCATELLDGFDSLFDIFQDSQCESVQIEALVIMGLILKKCPKVGARSIFWSSRAVETLAPLLEEQDGNTKELALELLLGMPCPEWDTFYRPPSGYSCMRHIASMAAVPMHIFRYFKHRKREVGHFFAGFLDELQEDGLSRLLDIPDLVEDTVCVLREESKGSWLSWCCGEAIVFLCNLVRFDRSHRVSAQLVIDTELIQMLILRLLSCDPEQQDGLREFMENRLFSMKCSKLLLHRLRWPDIEAQVHDLCRHLSFDLGNKVIIETVQSLVSRGLQEMVHQLKKSDEEQEQQAFLFKLLLVRNAQGWIDEIQIGGYFLGAAEALDRLVFTSVYCQQESLRADALEILGICVCVLEDGKNPLQTGKNQRQQQLQMILQAVSAILDHMSGEGYGVFLKFLRRLEVECKQSSSVILKYPKVVQSLIELSIQDADQQARLDALRCLHICVCSFRSKVITEEGINLLQELSKALALIAYGSEADNNMWVQNFVVALLRNLMQLGSRKDLDERTGSLLSVAFELNTVGNTRVLENLVALLERDEANFICGAAIDVLLYARKKSAEVDHIAQLPGALVHVISTKVGKESASRAVPMLVFCAIQNGKALSYLTGLLGKHIRSVLRVDATIFLMKMMSDSVGDPEQPLLMSLQTTWVRCFPGKDWESYFPGKECSDYANLEPHVLAGLIWLSEISLRMQLRVPESLTGVHAGELAVVERHSADGIVSRCTNHVVLLFYELLVCIGWS